MRIDGGPRRDLPERAFAFARDILLLCQQLDSHPGVGRTVAQQLLRAGTSVGANIEEGQASQSRADFVSKYSIACKEAREALYWLRLIAAAGLVAGVELRALTTESNELVAILTAIVKNTRRNALQAGRGESA